MFEPCPCNSPVWESSWSTFDLPGDLWRSHTSQSLGCAQRCCGSSCSAVVLLVFRLATLGFCTAIWIAAYKPSTETRLANDLESFTMQVRAATSPELLRTPECVTVANNMLVSPRTPLCRP